MKTAVSLFSGCGGSDTGIHNAGFEIIMANDIIPYAKDVYLSNLPETDYILGNVEKIEHFPSSDLLVGCYPCQGFSQGGARVADKKVNYLYKEFARALSYIKPKAFIVENVSGMIRKTFAHLLEDQIKTFSEAGYIVKHQILNAADFGVAQNRKRIFIVGIRDDIDFNYQFPQPTYGTSSQQYKSIKEALDGLDEWPEGEFYDEPFHWYYMSRNRRQGWKDLSKTIVSSARHMPLHPISPKMEKVGNDEWKFIDDSPARRFSYREAAILQGFSKKLVFPDNENSSLKNKYKVIGNAVPPPLFEVVARALPNF